MDISTVQKKFNEHQYATFEDFNKDVKLIWSNAMTYNPKHSAIYGWTLEISKFYDGLVKSETENDKMRKMKNRVNSMDSGVNGGSNKRGNRYKGPNMDMPLTYQEKKELSRMIRSLETEHLLGVWEIVSEGNDQIKNNEIEFDIETLPVRKARELEKYVRSKLEIMNKIRNNQNRKNTPTPPVDYTNRTFKEDKMGMGVNLNQPAQPNPNQPPVTNQQPAANQNQMVAPGQNPAPQTQTTQQFGGGQVSQPPVQRTEPINTGNVNMNWNNPPKTTVNVANRKDSDSSFISSLDDSDGD